MNDAKIMLQIRSLIVTRDVSVSFYRRKDDFQDLIHPEGREPGIPRYVEREGEDTNLKRARYRSKYIGGFFLFYQWTNNQ